MWRPSLRRNLVIAAAVADRVQDLREQGSELDEIAVELCHPIRTGETEVP